MGSFVCRRIKAAVQVCSYRLMYDLEVEGKHGPTISNTSCSIIMYQVYIW